jgi:hypothetical protein
LLCVLKWANILIRGSTSTAGKKFLMWNKREEIGRRGREERKHRIC